MPNQIYNATHTFLRDKLLGHYLSEAQMANDAKEKLQNELTEAL